MERIIYTCNPKHLGYEFPKRKWWDFLKKDRTAEILLTDIFPREYMGIMIRIVENGSSDYSVQIEERCMRHMRRIFLGKILEHFFEAVLIVDPIGETFSDILPDFADDMNYLAVITQRPWLYDDVMERIEDDTGLIGMVYEDYRDFNRYQKMLCNRKRTLVLLGETGEENRHLLRYRFPENSFFADFTVTEEYRSGIMGKRLGADYISMPIFLDNMVKSRYNSLVNEGL